MNSSCLNFTDEELVYSIQKGNSEYMGHIYNRFQSKVLKICLNFFDNKDDASDYSHDIMMKVFEKINSFKHESKFSTWVFSIAINHCKDLLRKTKTKSLIKLDNNSDSIDYYCLRDEDTDDFNIIIAQSVLINLTSEEQSILKLKYESKLTINQIEKQLSISSSAVKMRLLRARNHAINDYSKEIKHLVA